MVGVIIPIIREIESKKESSLVLKGAFDIFVAHMPKNKINCARIHFCPKKPKICA